MLGDCWGCTLNSFITKTLRRSLTSARSELFESEFLVTAEQSIGSGSVGCLAWSVYIDTSFRSLISSMAAV